MPYKFLPFEKINRKYIDQITVTSGGAFGFPSYFYEKNHIKNYKYVIVHYDQEQKAVGLKFVSDESERKGFKIIHSLKGQGAYITAKSFFFNYGLDINLFSGKYKYQIEADPEYGEIYVIILKEKIVNVQKTDPTPQI